MNKEKACSECKKPNKNLKFIDNKDNPSNKKLFLCESCQQAFLQIEMFFCTVCSGLSYDGISSPFAGGGTLCKDCASDEHIYE